MRASPRERTTRQKRCSDLQKKARRGEGSPAATRGGTARDREREGERDDAKRPTTTTTTTPCSEDDGREHEPALALRPASTATAGRSEPAAVEERVLDERADEPVARLAAELGRVAHDARERRLAELARRRRRVLLAAGRVVALVLVVGARLALARGRRALRAVDGAARRALGRELLAKLDDEGREVADVAAVADRLVRVAQLGDKVRQLRRGVGAVLCARKKAASSSVMLGAVEREGRRGRENRGRTETSGLWLSVMTQYLFQRRSSRRASCELLKCDTSSG